MAGRDPAQSRRRDDARDRIAHLREERTKPGVNQEGLLGTYDELVEGEPAWRPRGDVGRDSVDTRSDLVDARFHAGSMVLSTRGNHPSFLGYAHADIMCPLDGNLEHVRQSVLRSVRREVTVDAAFFAVTDPETLLFAAAAAEEPLAALGPLFLDNELRAVDKNPFVDVARARVPVATLDRATRGVWSESLRSRELMAPLGLGDEMRVALRAGDVTWGFLCLHREGAAPFTSWEVEAVRYAAGRAAVTVRDAVASVAVGAGGVHGDERALLLLDDEIVLARTGRVLRICGVPLEPGARAPLEIVALVRRLEAMEREHHDQLSAPSTLLFGPTSFIEARAERLQQRSGRGPVAVTLAPVAPRALSTLRLAASGATLAQRRVAALVLRGLSTKEISSALHIGEHTVQDHLKAIFLRFGVSSRRELVYALMR